MNCRLCRSADLDPIIDLGRLPIAHRLLDHPDQFEETFPLALHVCRQCGLIQILNPVAPTILYTGFNYNFSSWKPEPHQGDEIETIVANVTPRKVLEIGCNDGRFLDELKGRGVNIAVGIELNPVPAAIAKDRGLDVINEAVSRSIGHQIVEDHGMFDLVVSRQVLEHVLDFDAFFGCVDAALSLNGLLFIDVPDFTDLLKQGDCSGIWEEHPTYFTRITLSNLLGAHGFEIIAEKSYDFSGGCLSVLARRARRRASITAEKLDLALGYGKRVTDYGRRLKAKITDAKGKGATIVLFGVGCRACTLVNGLDLGGLIDYAVDDQKERQGLYMPGSRLPIYPSEKMRQEKSEVLCLLAVNNENDAMVSARFAACPAITFVSVFAPKDIRAELT